MSALNVSQKQTQTQSISPQLKAAIRLLQLPTASLESYLRQQLENNPLLESETLLCDEGIPIDVDKAQSLSETITTSVYEKAENTRENSTENYLNTLESCETVADKLLKQAHLSLDPKDHSIAEIIIFSLNDQGFLAESSAVLCNAVQTTTEHFEKVRQQIMHFDPLGCASQNMVEFILLQLQEKSILNAKHRALLNATDLLLAHDWQTLGKRLKITAPDLKKLMEEIRATKVQPIDSSIRPFYIKPDLCVVDLSANEQRVILKSQQSKAIQLQTVVYDTYKQSANSAELKKLKEYYSEGVWLIRALQQRESTLLDVGNFILRHQKAYFQHGLSALKPLNLSTAAQELGVHESTVSRIVAHKYLETRTGVLPLKFFFSSGISKNSFFKNASVSNRHVKERLKTLIQEEPRSKPHSDATLSSLLAAEGLKIARRTITKYREALKIEGASVRKRKKAL